MRSGKLRSVFSAVLCVLIFVSFTAGLLTMALDNTFDSSADLAIRAADEEYCRKMHEELMIALEKKMALVVIKTEDIADLLDEDELAGETRLATAAVMGEIFGGSAGAWTYENEELKVRIETLLGEYAAENGIEYEDGSAERVYGLICETVTSELRALPESYTAKAAPTAEKLQKVLDFKVVPLVLFVILTAAELLIMKRHLKTGIYSVVLPTYLGAFTVLAASSIMYAKDYFGETVIEGMIGILIRKVYLTVFGDMRQAGAVLTGLFLIMGLAISIALARKRRKKSRPRHRKIKLKAEIEEAEDGATE